MAGTSNQTNGYWAGNKVERDGVWHPQFIRKVIMRAVQKLKPRNKVACRFSILMEFLVNISNHQENWLSIVSCLMGNMPVDSYTTNAILIIMRSIRGADVDTVTNLLTDRFNLSQQRALAPILNIEMEKNICIVLNCIAERDLGFRSTLIFSHEVCSYLCHIVVNTRLHNDAELQLKALLALEKFSTVAENKRMVEGKLAELNVNHLTDLESFRTETSADNGIWREIRYCAKWTLDNIFPKDGRQLSYETEDTSNINVMMKNNNTNIFIKYSADLMEIRNDTLWSQTLQLTCRVTGGIWYYEVTLVTKGSLIIGWGISGSDPNKTVGYEGFSMGFEGNKKYIWYYNRAYVVSLGVWKEGDVLGCLLNINKKAITFFLNGKETTVSSQEFFAPTEDFKNFFPVMTLSPFQQCVVNMGHKPFRNPPAGVRFSTFNSVGELSVELKRKFGVPRRVTQQQDAVYNTSEDACFICCDNIINITMLPCQHRILCFACSVKISHCPICRCPIVERN